MKRRGGSFLRALIEDFFKSTLGGADIFATVSSSSHSSSLSFFAFSSSNFYFFIFFSLSEYPTLAL